jgi:hypothetical protein
MDRTQAVALVSALVMLGFVLNLVRQRRLREEYSWLWLLAASFYLVAGLFPSLVSTISGFLGITSPVTTLFFFGLFFTIIILIHYSVKLSRLATHMKDVAQQIAILEGEQSKFNQVLDKIYNPPPSMQITASIEEKNILYEPLEVAESEVKELTSSIG